MSSAVAIGLKFVSVDDTLLLVADSSRDRLCEVQGPNHFFDDSKLGSNQSCELSRNNIHFRNDDGEVWCRRLDVFGGSEDMRQQYRRYAAHDELCGTFMSRLTSQNESHFIFGSQAEGTTVSGMNSDRDIVLCDEKYPVVTKISESVTGLCFLMFQDLSTQPGYVKLQLVNNGLPLNDKTKNLTVKNHKLDKHGVWCLDHNTAYTHYCSHKNDNFIRNGPAFTAKGREKFHMPTDYVPALMSSSIPAFANEWIRKQSKVYWPSRDLLDEMTRLGCLVVPVGYPKSSEQDLEWRVSFSLQERLLMSSLNPVQHKCYIYLKLIKQQKIQPYAGDAISSYHMKTSVFNLKTITAEGLWCEQNLVICVRLCLLIILTWVNKKYCPNFFIPTENMFDRRMTEGNFATLRDLIQTLVYSSPLHVCIPDPFLCRDMQSRLSRDTRGLSQMCNEELSMNLQYRVMYTREAKRRHLVRNILLTSDSAEVYYKDLEERFKLLPQMSSPFHTAEENKTARGMCSLLLKSMLMQSCASVLLGKQVNEHTYRILTAVELSSRQHKTDNERHVRQLSIPEGNTKKEATAVDWLHDRLKVCLDYSNSGGQFSDVMASDLVLASVLFKIENSNARDILDEIEKRDTDDVISFCQCTDVVRSFGGVRLKDFYTDGKINHIATCVILTHLDIPIMLEPLHFELVRSVGAPNSPINYLYDFWFTWAVVDARVYLHFTRYRLCRDRSDLENKRNALRKLKQVTRHAEKFVDCVNQLSLDTISFKYCLGHIETAWNLIGWIYVQEGMVDAAVRCFTRSWPRRRNHNAAKWHLTMLLFDLIR